MGAWRAFVLVAVAWWGLARADDPPIAAPPAPSGPTTPTTESPAPDLPAPEVPAPVEPAPPAPAPTPPIDQRELNTWWKAAGELWMDETAYKADGTTFDGGVCRYKFDEGVIIPVFTGRKPVSERRVGLVFIGKGSLEMSFPDKGDAQAFANHMVLRAGRDPKDFAAIAHGEAPYVVPIENGLILSADPDVQRALFDLEPIGAGVVIKEAEEGGEINEYYTVTENRGKTRARVTATNLIPQRRRLLQLSGIDPLAMLRQDRFLYEELGVPKEDLRFIADFRTTDHYRVAEPQQGGVLAGDHDRWLTCYRDPTGFLDSGYETMVFAHGVDREGDRHFERFDGKRLEPDADGRLADPAFEPLQAETTIEAKPKGITANYIDASVKSTITLKAVGQDRYSIALALPNWNAVPKTFELQSLTTADGKAIAWAGIYADLPYSAGETRNAAATATQGENAQLTGSDAEATTAETSTDAAAGGVDTTSPTQADASAIDDVGQAPGNLATEASMQILNQVTTRERYEIIAMLPEVVRAGETVTLNLTWKARWPYANWAAMSASDSEDGSVDTSTLIAKPLGTTTGAQAFLPRLLPSTGLGEWKTKTTVGVPGLGIRSYDVAVTGDTIQEWQSDDGWKLDHGAEPHGAHPDGRDRRLEEHVRPASDGTARGVGPPVRERDALPRGVRARSPAGDHLPRQVPSRLPVRRSRRVPGRDGRQRDQLLGKRRDRSHRDPLVRADGDRRVRGRARERLPRADAPRAAAREPVLGPGDPAGQRARRVDHRRARRRLRALLFASRAEGREATGARLRGVPGSARRAQEELRESRRAQRRDRTEPGRCALDPLVAHGLHVADGHSGEDARRLPHLLLGADAPLADWRRPFLRHARSARAAFDGSVDLDGGGRARVRGSIRSGFLGAYFDQWVHGGLVPKLEAWTERRPDGALVGCIHSDVPFGHLEVPVRVGEPYETKGGGEGKDVELMNPEEALVDVIDGWGTFRVPKQSKNAAAVLDPDSYLMTIGRKVHAGEWNEACPTVP